eukprot:scaffold11933_cov117-Skeletonema_dohrnii-CCMP3373.AAC.11
MSNLRSAMKLYQENGDPTSSLRECQKVWNQSSPSASVEDGADKDDKSAAAASKMKNNDEVNNTVGAASPSAQQLPVSRQHNEAILQNLSAQRQRSRRVRPRPSSFDGNSANTNDDNRVDANNNSTADDIVEIDEQQNSAAKSNNGGGDLITVLNNILTTLSIKNHQQMTNPPNGNNDGQPLNNNEEVQKLIAVYNLSLAQYAQGEYTEALNELGGVLFRWMDVISNVNTKSGDGNTKNGGKNIKESDGENKPMVQFKQKDGTLLHFPLNSNYVTSIMSILTSATFLFLDCSLNVHAGNGQGLMEAGANNGDDIDEGKNGIKSVQDVLKWVENVILVYAKQQINNDEDEGMGSGGDDDVLTADEVKFKLHLYKSRVLLQGTRGVSGKQQQQQKMDGETRARLARKELKNAMDIYQNKLCVVVEDGGGSEGKGGGGSNFNEKGKSKGGGGSKQRRGKGNNHNQQQDTSETTSISGSLVTSASDGLWNEGKSGGVARATFEGMPNNKQQQQQQSQPQLAAATASSSTTPAANKAKVKKDTPGLHVRHESVLYMKANLEYMRGNTTKSLKLCAEARTVGKKSRVKTNGGGGQSEENGFAHNDAAAANGNKTDSTATEEDVETQMANDYDEAIYYNNLAMVHQSAGKIHVASHYYSYAISYMENVQLPNDNYFWSDGVPRPNVTADILNNASLCAFQAHDYKRAYECMAHCVMLSPSIFGERARCWLRMAQSLIGIYANQQWTTNSTESGLINDISLLECNLGSEDDMHNISSNPFPRILSCLEKAQNLSSALKEGKDVDADLECFEASTLSLAYAKLEIKDAAGALEMCKVILGTDNIAAIAKEERSKYTSESLRRRAMARLYACEAFCRLGDPNSALFIVESESSLQCLASDISASNSTQHDAYAQFATRATASGTFSSTGSLDRSKLHASMTSRVAENLTADKTKGNIDNVFEKRVHLFSRLKEGDTDGAIAILRSGMGRV